MGTMQEAIQTPPEWTSIFQKIACATGIYFSSTIESLAAHQRKSVSDEWVSHMFLECNVPTCAHNIEFAFLYIDPSGSCIDPSGSFMWPHNKGPSFPDAAELSDSLIMCCHATSRNPDFVWVVDIILKCGVSIWHRPFLERQSIFAASMPPPFFKVLNFKPAQALVQLAPQFIKRSPRGIDSGSSGHHAACADYTIYMYRQESLFHPIELQNVRRLIGRRRTLTQIIPCKEFICTFRHPLLQLHQEGRLMPLINRLCVSGALREDLSENTEKEALHLYSYQNIDQGQDMADADLVKMFRGLMADDDLAKMFRGLILDKRVYPPKIVCLPLLAFETVENLISEAEFRISHKEQILEASVKMDGTSIVMACYQGRVVVATKNRFKSRRVDLVKAILQARRITESAFRENHTYICEYIGGPNCRVINYPFEGLCLLTVIDNLTGFELDYESRRSMADSLGFITPATVWFTPTSSFGDVINHFSGIYGDIEGVVVRTPDGKRFKIKTRVWREGVHELYSVSPLSVWASELESIPLWPGGESSLFTEISGWLRERAHDLLMFQDFQLDPYAGYIATCCKFDVLQCRSAYYLHARIIRDSAVHGTNICRDITACSTCIAVWFFLKPYSNRVCWETCSMLSRDRIRTVLEDDWHQIDTAQAPYVQWLGDSIVTDLVFQYMDHRDLSVCRRVCRHWHLYINQNFEDAISNSFYSFMNLECSRFSFLGGSRSSFSEKEDHNDYWHRGHESS